MIDARGDAAALTYGIGFAIVVGKRREAGGAQELGDDRAASERIRKEDGIRSGDVGVPAILDQPSCRRRRSVRVESAPQGAENRLGHNAARVEAGANGRFAAAV